MTAAKQPAPRFVVDKDLVAVHDTETDEYAGFVSLEDAERALAELNATPSYRDVFHWGPRELWAEDESA